MWNQIFFKTNISHSNVWWLLDRYCRRVASRVWRVRQRIFNVEFAQHAPSNSQRRETSPVSRLRQTLHRLVESLLPPYDSHQGIRPLLFRPKIFDFFLFLLFKKMLWRWASRFDSFDEFSPFFPFFVWPYQPSLNFWMARSYFAAGTDRIFIDTKKSFPIQFFSGVFLFYKFIFFWDIRKKCAALGRLPHERYLCKECKKRKKRKKKYIFISKLFVEDKRMSFFCCYRV